ncbi:MAG TPA: KUP/HAK/KT family potassium transporter [Mycobacteriales bacterium]|nr:KUP/HAK/KT family potassium transporter [Mycobacteriales bacterium]
MTELLPDTGPDEEPAGPEPSGHHYGRLLSLASATAAVAALGVVFGDIGTSPLYALQTVFSADHGRVHATSSDVYGVISLVFWSITVVVSGKYVIFVLRADNHGEGGVMALAALVRRSLDRTSVRAGAIIMAIGVLGAALFYGDSVITPAISVLSAVEGLKVAAPSLAHVVLPTAAVILTALFVVQRWGTGRIGASFGPIMLLWFVALAVLGLREVIPHPGVLRGLSPSYGALFLIDHPLKAFIAMGAVVLAVTGAEALYADLGHFGRTPIRRAWFAVVFPALTLNYLAQGALILQRRSAKSNPFFLLAPGWARVPLVVLATMATVIASQAVISGAFSVSRQAVRLGFLPHLRIHHTSSEDVGRVYLPAVNWALFAAVVAVMLGFGSSTRLATAYGVAVTGTFLITTALFLVVARLVWRWNVVQLLAAGVIFGGAELSFFVANMTKLVKGAWLPLVVAAVIFTVMMTWQRGRELVTVRRSAMEGDLDDFLAELGREGPARVPGTAVFPHGPQNTAPLALRLNVERNHVLHEHVVIVSAHTANVPHLPWRRRLRVDWPGDPDLGVIRIAVDFGFQDHSSLPEALAHANAEILEGVLDLDDATYFLSRVTLKRTDEPGMGRPAKVLFIALAHNATNVAGYLWLPEDRTVSMAANLDF